MAKRVFEKMYDEGTRSVAWLVDKIEKPHEELKKAT
jgi:hypothetical protein